MNQYQITVKDGDTFAVYFNGTDLFTATDDNPQLDTILERMRAGDFDGIEELFNMEAALRQTFQQITERVAVRNGHVFFDGEVLDDAIEGLILRSLDAKTADYLPVVNFLEKVYTNISEHTRENLLTWLRAEDFQVTTTGDIVAYKGLRSDFTSITRGPATVDGEDVNGNVPNSVGSVVEIRRSDVVADPAQGCAYGLHAGTYGYASGFAQGALVEVHINPRDVVSVPTDCGAQKMRVARYRVVQQITTKPSETVRPAHEDDDFDVDYDDAPNADVDRNGISVY